MKEGLKGKLHDEFIFLLTLVDSQDMCKGLIDSGDFLIHKVGGSDCSDKPFLSSPF